MKRTVWLTLIAASIATGGFLGSVAFAAENKGHTGTEQSTRLYTRPDTSSKGGIVLKLGRVKKNLQMAFAVPQFEPKSVYKGHVESGDQVSFEGLPAAKYDLMLLFEDEIAEGFRLTRAEDTLTAKDRTNIAFAINKSVQFFNLKEIHRCEGTTGRDGTAMCFFQEMRTKPVTLQSAEVRSDIQIRSIKLAMMDDVGPGWALTQTREIVRQEVANNERKGLLPHKYYGVLGGVRVTDSIKDMGVVDLTK